MRYVRLVQNASGSGHASTLAECGDRRLVAGDDGLATLARPVAELAAGRAAAVPHRPRRGSAAHRAAAYPLECPVSRKRQAKTQRYFPGLDLDGLPAGRRYLYVPC